jgi:hypothetical protein
MIEVRFIQGSYVSANSRTINTELELKGVRNQ